MLALGPKRVASVLDEVRKAGLADEGPAWALKQREMAALVRVLGPKLKRKMERDRRLGQGFKQPICVRRAGILAGLWSESSTRSCDG
jgi:hypothetical protein